LNEPRVRLALVEKRALRSVPLGLTSSMARGGTAPTDASVPRWTALVPDGYVAPDRYMSDRAVNECSGIRAIAEVTDRRASSTQTFVALTEVGESVVFGADGAIQGREAFPGLMPIGVGCSVYLDGTW